MLVSLWLLFKGYRILPKLLCFNHHKIMFMEIWPLCEHKHTVCCINVVLSPGLLLLTETKTASRVTLDHTDTEFVYFVITSGPPIFIYLFLF